MDARLGGRETQRLLVEVRVTRQQQPHQRRRGSELEDTILRAAWAELLDVGYARLTMEGVAARAHTGKQVLYRRWRNRPELVLAAMRHTVGSISADVPDTGGLRGDVLAVLEHMAARQREVPADVVHGLMIEAPEVDPEFLDVMTGVMARILEQAQRRGEIATAALPPRVVSAPANLARHEILLRRTPVARETLEGIVDEVFLPLVRAAQPGVQSSSTGSDSTP